MGEGVEGWWGCVYPPEAPVIRASFPSMSLSTAGILDCVVYFQAVNIKLQFGLEESEVGDAVISRELEVTRPMR